MNTAARCSAFVATCLVMIGVACRCPGGALDRAAIAAHQDQLQNIVMECEETRAYDIDPAAVAKVPPHFRQPQVDLKRTEAFNLSFSFLDGNAYYDRETNARTLNYWAAKGLPAIARQRTSISATGRIEELTTQRLANGKIPSFGGVRQLSEFSPDDTIDIAMGLRLLGGRRWLTKDDLGAMEEIRQPDSTIAILHTSDGSGDVHELRFDKRLLFALVNYRCTNPHGAYVEITNSDFVRQGNVCIPGKIVRTSNIMDSIGEVRHPLVFTIIVRHASIGDPTNTASQYFIAWPAHLQLFDARTNDRIEVGPTTRPLSDDDIRQQLAEKRTRELMLEDLARQRIRSALDGPPTTQP
jgi:hypothetical protein